MPSNTVKIDDGRLVGIQALRRVHCGRDSIQIQIAALLSGRRYSGAEWEKKECVRVSHSSRRNGTVRRSPASPASSLGVAEPS